MAWNFYKKKLVNRISKTFRNTILKFASGNLKINEEDQKLKINSQTVYEKRFIHLTFTLLYLCRLDFVTFITAVGATGLCGNTLYDSFTVTQPTRASSNPLCGVNTGLHSK